MRKIITLYTALMLAACVNAQQFTLNASVTTIVNITGLNGQLKKLAIKAHIFKNLTFHIARHSFATTITLNNDVPFFG